MELRLLRPLAKLTGVTVSASIAHALHRSRRCRRLGTVSLWQALKSKAGDRQRRAYWHDELTPPKSGCAEVPRLRGVTMSTRTKSGCLCGTVGFQVEGEALWISNCHCASCRRHSGSAVASFVGFRSEQVSCAAAARQVYASSPEFAEVSAASAGRRSVMNLTSSRMRSTYTSAHWMTRNVSRDCFTCSMATASHGSISPMTDAVPKRCHD